MKSLSHVLLIITIFQKEWSLCFGSWSKTREHSSSCSWSHWRSDFWKFQRGEIWLQDALSRLCQTCEYEVQIVSNIWVWSQTVLNIWVWSPDIVKHVGMKSRLCQTYKSRLCQTYKSRLCQTCKFSKLSKILYFFHSYVLNLTQTILCT